MTPDQPEQNTSRRTRTAWYRRHRVVLVVIGALVLVAGALTTGAYVLDPGPGAAPQKSSANPPTDPPKRPSAAPSDPPARICNNGSVLDGPKSAPAGAVSVSTSQDLTTLTFRNPPGTTFWLSRGTHTFESTPFSQVVPKDGNTYLGAPGAILDGRHINRYAFTGYASDVTVKYLTVQNFGRRGANSDEGVMNHDAATGWILERNTIWKNAGAAVMVGTRNVLRDNCLMQNGQYGFNAYNPNQVTDITIQHNEIAGNNTDDWEKVKPGCGCTGGGKFWRVEGAVVSDNWVHDNKSVGLWADTNNVGFAFEGNYISDNHGEGILYETSYNAVIRRNTFVRNGHVKGPTNSGFPTSAVYVSESGSDRRVKSRYWKAFEISGNVFTDNWAGVILWENADRFAGSPANTSTDASTLVKPRVVTARSCNAANIRKRPYIDDCRWKTQNVRVHNNLFTLDPDEIGKTCSTKSGCGFNGVFSNWGTFPDWSPYKATYVQERITFDQNNRFFSNTYAGPWHFIIKGQGTKESWATWQGAPYDQDSDSVIKVRTPAGE